MEIKKKIWPEFFQKVLAGERNTEVRLADFDVSKGDVLVLEEYDPKTKKYTGRKIRKKVKNVNKLNLLDFQSAEQIKRFGHWVIELE